MLEAGADEVIRGIKEKGRDLGLSVEVLGIQGSLRMSI